MIEVEVKTKKFKNGKAAVKDEVTGEGRMSKTRGEFVTDCVRKLGNMTFLRGVVLGKWDDFFHSYFL